MASLGLRPPYPSLPHGGLDEAFSDSRITYANVVATLALFLALAGGTVWAANKINGKQIKKYTIPGNRIKKNTLTANHIKKKTITNNQIKPGSIERTSLAAAPSPADHRRSLGDKPPRRHQRKPRRGRRRSHWSERRRLRPSRQGLQPNPRAGQPGIEFDRIL